jgi:hypothetical protein
VEVHEIREDIFHARIFLSGGEFPPRDPLVIDSRPSDAFALAIREKCPVFVAARVLDRTGIPADIFIEEEQEEGRGPPPGAEEPYPAEPFFAYEWEGKAREGAADEKDIPGFPALTAQRRRLQAELEETIEEEAYERAAEIRDLLILLDQQIEQKQHGKGIT